MLVGVPFPAPRVVRTKSPGPQEAPEKVKDRRVSCVGLREMSARPSAAPPSRSTTARIASSRHLLICTATRQPRQQHLAAAAAAWCP